MSLILWYRFVRLKRVPLARHGLKKNKIKKVIDEEEKKEEEAAHVYEINHLSELPSNVHTARLIAVGHVSRQRQVFVFWTRVTCHRAQL